MLKKILTMKSLLQRLKNRPDTEHEAALIRIVLSVLCPVILLIAVI